MSLKRKRSAPVIILLSSDSSDGDSSAKSGPTCKGSSQRKPRSTPVKPPLSGNINSKAGQRHSTALDSPSKRATEDVGERGNSHGKKNKYKNKTSFKSYKYISRRGKPVPSTLLSRWLVRVEVPLTTRSVCPVPPITPQCQSATESPQRSFETDDKKSTPPTSISRDYQTLEESESTSDSLDSQSQGMGPSKKRKVARSESQTGPRKRANRPSTTSSATSPRRGDAPGNHSRPVRACRSNVKYNCSPDVDGESSELSSEPPSGAEEDAEALDPEVSDTYQPSSRPSSNAGEDVEDFDMGTIADDMESASASDEIMLDEDKEGYEVDLPAESFMTNKDLNTKGKPTAGKRPRLSTKASSGKPRKSGWTYKKGINVDLPPLCDISEIFADLTRKAIDKLGLQTALNFLGDKKLRIGTMCSGTESPLLALGLVGDALRLYHGTDLEIEHAFSAEIVPFKQAYIERNFHPPVIFRDIRQMATDDKAETAYGAPSEVPGDLDFLIAGFSCVDFSRLNAWNKNLDDVGESGDTFRSILNYAKKHRPAIIILENVLSAPWKVIQSVWEKEEYDYAAAYTKVDTKSFYIPHTRQRGYMICIDKRRLKSAQSSVQKWTTLMKAFERPASCSVDSFLLDEDDPRVHRCREEPAKHGNMDPRASKEVDWTVCQGRHQNYREDQNLGSGRPFTHWIENGSCKVVDYGWQLWVPEQVDRIKDVLDMSFLRNVARGFDSREKVRVWELSQNIDRFQDTTPFGITNCMTPTGTPFLTTRGGPIIGQEAISLQGLPINKMLLTREAQGELQDLAGNAMTTTVVGAAILSALIVGFDALQGQERQTSNTASSNASQIQALDTSHLKSRKITFAAVNPQMSVQQLRKKATDSFRRCYCEGRTQTTTRRILICHKCQHTSCEACAGIPSHDYRALSSQLPNPRIDPQIFANDIRKVLPMRLHLANLDLRNVTSKFESVWAAVNSAERKLFSSTLERSLSEEYRFYASKRSQVWTIYYEAPFSRLELEFSYTAPRWLLFVKPDRKEPVNSKVRQTFKRPVARMVVEGSDLLQGQWQLCLPVSAPTVVTIEGKGNLVPSWESRLGLLDFADTKVWPTLQVRLPKRDSKTLHLGIEGDYELLQDCGTASGCLHKKVSLEKDEPLYLFLEPDRVGDPERDQFVFSTNTRKLNHGETRLTDARLEASWRPSDISGPKTINCDVYGRWVDCGATMSPFKDTVSATYAVPGSDMTVDLVTGMSTIHDGNGSAGTNCAESTRAILSCRAPISFEEITSWREGRWYLVDETNERQVFTSLTWLTERIRDLQGFSGDWRRLNLTGSHGRCQTCAPDRPQLLWAWKKDKIVPYEEPESAFKFEDMIKGRPSPFVVQVRIGNGLDGRIIIGLNIPTLAHRALAKLPDLETHKGVQLSWRLDTQYAWPVKVSLRKFSLGHNKNDPEASHKFEFNGHNLGVLRKEQQRSLQWMLNQEDDAAPAFYEQEIEEACIPHLGWRAEVRARRPRQIRGGILADEVGYGKTLTTLALIDAQQGKANTTANVPRVGAIPLKATLIIVPRTLVKQWEGQIRKFLGRKYVVLVISNSPQMENKTVADFQAADIIISVWSVFSSSSYLTTLQELACLPEAPDGHGLGRPFDAWLTFATRNAAQHVEEMKSQQSLTDFGKVMAQRLVAAREDTTLQAHVASKRLRGEEYFQERQKAEAAKSSKKDSPKTSGFASSTKLKRLQLQGAKSIGQVKGLAFQMFHFNRLVVDEYTYVDEKEYALLTSVSASNRWILSGTPPLEDFADVKLIAGFLGAHLGIDDDARGVLKGRNIRAIRHERTAAEQFQSYVQDHSPAWHQHRQSHAQSFLDQFARQNTAEIDEIKCVQTFVANQLPAAEYALYIELQQQLMAQDMKMRKSGHSKVENDRSARLNELLDLSKTPEEALLKRCSHFRLDGNDSEGQENAAGVCDVILNLRKRQYSQTCKDLAKSLRHAVWLKQHCDSPTNAKKPVMDEHFAKWKGNVRNHAYGDPDTTKTLVRLIASAEAEYSDSHEDEFYSEKVSVVTGTKDKTATEGKTARKGKTAIKDKRSKKDDDDDDGEPVGVTSEEVKPNKFDKNDFAGKVRALRVLVVHLRGLSSELVARQRALRLFQSCRRVQRWQTDFKQGKSSRSPQCDWCSREVLESSQLSVLGVCGHFVCSPCFESLRGDTCGAKKCTAAAEGYGVIAASELGAEASQDCKGYHWGKKIEAICRLIKHQVPAEDQVLLFVQFNSLMEIMEKALDDQGISNWAITEAISNNKKSGGADLIDDFQSNASETRKKVLLLNPGNVSAAGANLTNANHVIFVSPLLTSNQHEYDASLTQSIGRARRYGQLKTVYVYRFVSLKTIDVDIVQQRSLGKCLVKTKDDQLVLKARSELTEDERNQKWSCGFKLNAKGYSDLD